MSPSLAGLAAQRASERGNAPTFDLTFRARGLEQRERMKPRRSQRTAGLARREVFARVLDQTLVCCGGGRLHPLIARRFGAATLAFSGTMTQVYCSLPGLALAWLLHPLRLLPPCCARDAGFAFRIQSKGDCFLKERRYRFTDGGEFVFRSRFFGAPHPREEFPYGVAMMLRLEAQPDGALLFASDGYRIRFARRIWQLPACLSARFELLHQSIDHDRFQVLLRISHPLLGTLFFQRGEFATVAE
jgi:hypothetical protein